MHEDTGFNFTEAATRPPEEAEFKRQRQAYLAERNARKLQEQAILRKQRPPNSSSDEEPVARPMPALLKQKEEGSNTDSSNSPRQSHFKKEREKYKQERLARRQEAVQNKRKEFGSSSSDDEDSVPIRPRAGRQQPPSRQIQPPQLKVQRVPFREEESSSFGFTSLQLGMGSARERVREGSAREHKGLLSSVRLKDKQSDRKQTRERYEVEVPSKKGVNIWLQRWLQFKETSIELAERSIALYDISKIKLIYNPTPSGSLRIKLTLPNEEEVFMAVNSKRINQVHYLDQYYFVFAKLVTLKLQLMGRRPQPITRVKSGLSQQILREARLAGKVRKSSFFGGWEEKIGVIGNSGLALYKEGKDKAGLFAAAGSVQELWTRFEFERENLVLKFLNGSSKVQLSVPCEDFLCRENWLYQLYSLGPK